MANKSPVSNAETYHDIGAFWDSHDAKENGGQAELEIDVGIANQVRYYPVDIAFTATLKQIAKKRGISEATLINLWIQEKIKQADNPKESISSS
jgi:hypothetical protein